MLAAALYFAAICGVVLRFVGIIACKLFVRWLLITISGLGVSSALIISYEGLASADMNRRVCYLGGLSVLLFINTLAALDWPGKYANDDGIYDFGKHE
jgi:hypothetical protein